MFRSANLSRSVFRRLCSLSVYRYCSNSKMPSAMVILSEGAEEMEAVITIDVLRRGGVDVTVAGLEGTAPVTCSRNVSIKPDVSLSDAAAKEYDAVICPGGAVGANNLAASAAVGEVLKKQEARGGIVACICAGPIALKSHGIGKGKKVTSHPSVEQQMREAGYDYSDERVVIDGKLVTSRAPGTCFEFALALVEAMQGHDKRQAIVPPMLLKE